jgi:hypothetical protein
MAKVGAVDMTTDQVPFHQFLTIFQRLLDNHLVFQVSQPSNYLV